MNNHYVITYGQYSDYTIDSVWDTELEAIKRIESKDSWCDHIECNKIRKTRFSHHLLLWNDNSKIKTTRTYD